MSFAIPKNVPSFSNPQRGLEDGYWASSGISRVPNGHTGNGIAGKLDAFFDKRQLPMYKDKPYKYAASGRSRRWFQRRRVLASVLLGVLGLAWWFGAFSSAVTVPDAGSLKTSWKWGTKPQGSKVDWDSRRERVKDAFISSWDGYEKHAWGTLYLYGR